MRSLLRGWTRQASLPRSSFPSGLRGVVRRALDASSRRLLLFVDAVDAAVGALEVPEGVLHPLDARDLAKKLASRRRELR
jgi:hypothetical protein